MRHICPLVLIHHFCLQREFGDGTKREEPLWDLKRVLVRECSRLRGESKKVCSQGAMSIQREESWQILGALPPVPTTSAALIPTSIPKSSPKRVCLGFCGLHRIIFNHEYASRSGYFLLFNKSVPYCILLPHLRALSHGHLCGSVVIPWTHSFLATPLARGI